MHDDKVKLVGMIGEWMLCGQQRIEVQIIGVIGKRACLVAMPRRWHHSSPENGLRLTEVWREMAIRANDRITLGSALPASVRHRARPPSSAAPQADIRPLAPP